MSINKVSKGTLSIGGKVVAMLSEPMWVTPQEEYPEYICVSLVHEPICEEMKITLSGEFKVTAEGKKFMQELAENLIKQEPQDIKCCGSSY